VASQSWEISCDSFTAEVIESHSLARRGGFEGGSEGWETTIEDKVTVSVGATVRGLLEKVEGSER
jgi:hypothetical protein